jgi:hypothetical protein
MRPPPLKSIRPRSDPVSMINKWTTAVGFSQVLKLLIHAMLLLAASTSVSAVLHWPECQNGELNIQNKTQMPQSVWLQQFAPGLKAESEIQLQPNSNMKTVLNKTDSTERYTLLHFLDSTDIETTLQCDDQVYLATSNEGGIQTFKKSDLMQQTVYLKNLFTADNTFTIEILNFLQQPLHTFNVKLKTNEQRKIMLPTVSKAFYIRIQATNKFASFNLSSTGSENPVLIEAQKVNENLDGIFFEIGPRSGTGDTFIAQITDPKMIAKARLQISDPSLEKILFAKIKKGHNNQNRNFTSPVKSFWNWSVTEVTNIADIGSTSCNGLPQIVDDRIDSRSADPGRICFWTYRIKREVSSLEVATGQNINLLLSPQKK